MERGRDACKGAACIHNLSSSRLKTWPDSWRRAKRAKGVPCTRFYNLVTSTIYYERAYLTGEASSVSINSSSQDINVLYIVRNRFSRGVREGVREGIVKRSRCVIHPRAFPLRFFSFFFLEPSRWIFTLFRGIIYLKCLKKFGRIRKYFGNNFVGIELERNVTCIYQVFTVPRQLGIECLCSVTIRYLLWSNKN